MPPWSAPGRCGGEYGLNPAAALAIAHGSPADHTVRRLLPHLNNDAAAVAVARQLALQYDDLSDAVPAVGADLLLDTLGSLGLPWAVVTSADARLATARLHAAGIDPPLLITIEDVTAGKPDPEGYRLAATILGIDPTHCLVVEDAEPGLRAGRSAGAMTAALKGLPADLRIDDLGHLACLLTPRLGHVRHDMIASHAHLLGIADNGGDTWGGSPDVTSRTARRRRLEQRRSSQGDG